MKKRAFYLLILILFSLGAVYAQRGTTRSETINIRFASPLPRNSDFGRALDRMAAEWSQATGNAVNVFVSHDGREGNEQQMLTALSGNSIQVGLFSSAGIAEICPAVITLSTPFLIKTEQELDLVLREVEPVLNSKVRDGFVIIAWAKGGWMYVFTKEPVYTPADLRRQRLASSAELKEMNYAFRTMGFNVVEADMLNMGPRLASNAINAIYMIPTAIAPLQLHRHLNHMLNLPISPVMGAVVINKVTWDRLTASQQQAIMRATQKTIADFNITSPKAETDAINAMSRGGLTVNNPSRTQEDLWKSELDSSINSLVGSVFDRDIYQRITRILERARSGR